MKNDCPQFDVSQISKADRRNLGATFYKAVKEFYADPANLARFEEWNSKRLDAEKEGTNRGKIT